MKNGARQSGFPWMMRWVVRLVLRPRATPRRELRREMADSGLALEERFDGRLADVELLAMVDPFV